MNLFGALATFLLYKVIEKYKNFFLWRKIPTIVTAGVILIFILQIFKIDFQIYNKSARFLTFLLGPSTVALGFLIYKHFDLLKKNKRIIHTAFFIASILALFLTYIFAKLCGADLILIESLLPKSTTAPIALEISKNIGGIPEITACAVALSGMFGGVFGHGILKLLKVKNDVAIGLSIGAASHVIGTAKCIEKHKETQVVMASVALVAVGVLTALFAPLFLFLIKIKI